MTNTAVPVQPAAVQQLQLQQQLQQVETLQQQQQQQQQQQPPSSVKSPKHVPTAGQVICCCKLFKYSRTSHKRPPKMRRFCDRVRAGDGRLRESNSGWSFPRRGPDTFYSFCGKKIMSRNFKGRICVYT